MKPLFVFAFLSFVLPAADRSMEFQSGPFHVFSTSERAGREQLNYLEQFRYALGSILGKSDLRLPWKVEVMVGRKGAPEARGFHLGRDAYMESITEAGSLNEGEASALARLLLDENTERLPFDVENGLIDLFSTVQVNGSKVTLGAPPSRTSRDWARLRLFTVDPRYAGRTRVLISNLEQGSTRDAAYHNAFEKSAKEIEADVDAAKDTGSSGTETSGGRALSPRDFHPQPVDSGTVAVLLADLALAAGNADAAALYANVHPPEGLSGLALVAARNKTADAALLLRKAIAAESKDAQVYFQAGLLEPGPEKAKPLFAKAAEFNPQWAAPLYEQAEREAAPERALALLKKASSLEPRNTRYWQALALKEQGANAFVEAQKAWAGAERAAATDAERAEIRATRLKIESARADYEAAERKRKADEEARELQRVKDASMASIHRAEDAARKELNPNGAAPPKTDIWWTPENEGPSAQGLLQSFDCLGRQARLVIRKADGTTVRLLVRDASQIVVSGGAKTLACGVQHPPREISVQYTPKPDRRLGTSGEAAAIEFR